jgi:hypothetical protein
MGEPGPVFLFTSICSGMYIYIYGVCNLGVSNNTNPFLTPVAGSAGGL